MTSERPVIPDVLSRLKGFQRRAAENAFERMFKAEDSTGRFLIADEVGLGKTLIARGVAALAIDHLWETVDRIDVVYVCSNVAIARQNVRKLRFGKVKPVDRLTLLPVTIHDLEHSKLNFIAITPGTSLDPRSSLGIQRERRLIFHLLQRLWPVRGSGPKNLLQGNVRKRENWRESLKTFLEKNRISETLQARYHKLLSDEDRIEREAGGPGIKSRWEGACARFTHAKKSWPKKDRALRGKVVGELRTLLARCCIDALEPDLIILDEFQRFKHLLNPLEGDEAGELARRLFEWAGETGKVRVLMLSATPYKMYTLAHEHEEEDHYEDFLRTVEFLQRSELRTTAFKELLGEYRRGLYRLSEGDGESATKACREIETELRHVMSRTERTGSTGKRDGMLKTGPMKAWPVKPRELVDFVSLDRLAKELDVRNIIEVWKSAPYLLSFSDDYQLDRRVEKACKDGADLATSKLLHAAKGAFLKPEEVEAYAEIDPANARLRALRADMVESGLWGCLWLPPSCPSYAPSGAYASAEGTTKRLVFSAWRVVPRVISALLSYEVERQVFLEEDAESENTPEARERRRPLLRFGRTQGRLTGMPVLGLMYPSEVLAEIGNPKRYAREHSDRLDQGTILALVKQEVSDRLQEHIAGAPQDGPFDEAWYWAAPILLDLGNGDEARRFWEVEDLDYWWTNVQGEEAPHDEEGSSWTDHVDEAKRLARGQMKLGRVPEDLADLLAQVAVAGPATSALRLLAQVVPGTESSQVPLRLAAGQIAWGFRSLFNRPEATAIVRRRERMIPLWRMVLQHCVDGCLGDVLGEHLHVLRDLEGLFDEKPDAVLNALAIAVREATGLRTTRTSYRVLDGTAREPVFDRRNLRGHYALRFGADESEGEGQAIRADHVRTAFNSPFWPFVLATTSVGQEGLDFHAWCHAVVHWNLPSNPIDLEQREGRVHRFKGHAVRKNVARAHGQAELAEPTERDLWTGIFERARQATSNDGGGLVPYWVFETEGGDHIERHVLAHPHSKESLKIGALRKSLALYRMVFGQPRQDDLMDFLIQRVPESVLEDLLEDLQVNLAP